MRRTNSFAALGVAVGIDSWGSAHRKEPALALADSLAVADSDDYWPCWGSGMVAVDKHQAQHKEDQGEGSFQALVPTPVADSLDSAVEKAAMLERPELTLESVALQPEG